jgi:glycosyltransferase involved in cell wall biosynthesis
LTEELVEQGHEVTLFASGDSKTRARLVPGCRQSLRLDKNCVDSLAHHLVLIDRVLERAHEFDIIHFHTDYLHYPFSHWRRIPRLTTLHGRLNIPDLVPVYHRFPEEPVVSISDSQRAPLKWINWQGTVHHGLPHDLYKFHPGSQGYLAFVGRISPEKRVDRAIEIASRSGMPLKIAAKLDNADRDYFDREIRPLLKAAGAEYVGEIGEKDKNDFLGNAAALLFPIDWPEPFGLVMIEALACGTPVIAWNCGSVPEVIDHGVNGFVCQSIDNAIQAVGKVAELDRAQCRESFDNRFGAPRMARDYVRIYQRLIGPFEPVGAADYGRDHSVSGPVLHSRDVFAR